MRHFSRQWLGSLVLLLLGTSAAAAQDRVQGRVVSAETLQPLSGVLVSVQGANIGAVTDAEGRYSVSVPADATLTFQTLGYATQTIQVDGRSTIDVQLQVTALALDEIVAVGYTTQTRRSIAGAVSSVEAEVIEARLVTSVQDAMKGRVAGVNIRNSGQPGEAARVTIRGSAFTADNDPLYVVDGMYLDDLRNINPNDIASIQVLKDASAASQYGARAANGVIVITTKKGQAADNNRVTLRSSYGYQEVSRLIPMMNSREWAELYQEKYTNSREVNPTFPTVPAGVQEVLSGQNTYDTNWQEEITRGGHTQDHVLSISGGTPSGNANYFVSGGYTQQTGTMIETDFERYSLRANSQLRRGRFTFGENLLVARSNRTNPTFDGSGALGEALNMFPSVPVVNDGNFGPAAAIYGIGTANYPTFANNPVGGLVLRDNQQLQNEILGSVFGHVDILEGLQYRLQLGVRYNASRTEQFTREWMIRQNTGPFPASLSIGDNTRTQVLVEHLLNLNRTFGIHAFNATAGYTQERVKGDVLNASRATYSNEDIQVLNGGQSEINNSGTEVESRLNSYLARVGYTLLDRYILEGNYRRDGSSRFGPLNRWGDFYSGAVGWIVSDESFFSSVPLLGGAPYLKLRGSYGTQGNQDFADYEWQATIVSTDANGETRTCCTYLFGSGVGVLTSGLAAVSLSNPALKWQDNTMANVGFDLGLLDNRLSISAEYYVSESDGVLARVPLIPSVGSRQDPFVNAASIRNSGLELALQHTMSRGDLDLTTGFNVTTLNNEVLRLGGQDEDIIVGASRTAVGRPLGSFWVMETCGIFDTQAEIDAHGVQPNARPGDLCFVDQNGDGMITQNDDKHYAGAPYPDFDTGLFLDGRFRSFDFRVGVRGSFGQKAYNGIRPGLENTNGDSNAPAWLRPWRQPGDDANAPKAYWGGVGADNARGPNDRFLEDNSYIRLQNVQLGYVVPSSLLGRLGLELQNARVYVNLQDIHTFTDYLGFDPEFRGGALTPGQDGGGTYPNPRTIGIGIDIGF